MKGWMKFRHKGGIYSRLRSDQQLHFYLTEDCILIGSKDEENSNSKPEVSYDIHDAAITINQENTNQFEVVGKGYHLIFTVNSAEEALSWMSHLQLHRSMKQGVSLAPVQVQRKANSQSVDLRNGSNSQERKKILPSESGSLNGELVFDDPLSIATPNSGDVGGFEWDNQATSSLSPHSPSSEETSAVFQLSNELSSAKLEISTLRQRIQSYKDVLDVRDRQLFEVRDKASGESFNQVHVEDYKNLELQVRSYKEQNAVLNEEILKLNQMYNSAKAEAIKEKRHADRLARELQKCQRDYLAALSCCVYRPLVNPDDGAFFEMPERDRHIAIVKSLAKSMKSNHDRILGCSIPIIGKTEHIDAFSFAHPLPNDALQVQYLCNHLREAYEILIETDEDNQKNLNKWKKCIMDSPENFEITPQLRKLILQGVPSQYRAYLWQKLIHYYVADMRRNCGESYYEAILRQQEVKKDQKNFSKYLKQITMDVPRTMPNNRDYTVPDSPHRERLHNVLRAFCWHSPDVGYCQGFNFIAGGGLVFLEEEDAFWFLTAVVEKIFPPDYYRNGLAGLLADQYVLQQIISQELPKLSEHLSKFPEIDLAAVTTGWFLGLFFDCLPFQTLIRVWDCFLSHGHEAVYRIAFAMFKIFESHLVELNEPSLLLHGAKNITKLCIYPSHLIKEAFSCTFPPWEFIEETRSQMETELIEKHQKKMEERRYYDQRMLLLDEDQDVLGSHADDKYAFNCGAAGERIILSGSCRITRGSQLYEVEADIIRPLRLPVTDRVTCVYVVTDDVVLLGLFSGQLQAYSLADNSLHWSMSLSDVVLCIVTYDVMICVGTADGKLHFLQINDAETENVCAKKPSLIDSIELSKKPTTCCSHIPEQSCLWVASGPAIYVVSIQTNETDGFFLISSRIEFVSAMLHWSSYVLISVRGSSVIQLHGTEVYNNPPLLVFDVARQITLSPYYPMMPDDNEAKSPTSSRIASMVLISEGVFWVGTAGGDITIYMLESKVDSQSNDTDVVSEAGTSNNIPSSPFNLRMLRTQHAGDKSVRCLVKSQKHVVSCSGFYGDEGSVRMWNFEGDHTVVEVGVSESSSSEILEESKSLASSLRSLDADSRIQRPEGASETWKSIKSATAAAMKSRPKFRRFMNMWGN